jgi:hypothetical protein
VKREETRRRQHQDREDRLRQKMENKKTVIEDYFISLCDVCLYQG